METHLSMTFGEVADDLGMQRQDVFAVTEFLLSDIYFKADPDKQPQMIRDFLISKNIKLSTYANLVGSPQFVDIFMKTSMALYVTPRMHLFLDRLMQRALRDDRAAAQVVTFMKALWPALNAENQKEIHLKMEMLKQMSSDGLEQEVQQKIKQVEKLLPPMRDITTINGERVQ